MVMMTRESRSRLRECLMGPLFQRDSQQGDGRDGEQECQRHGQPGNLVKGDRQQGPDHDEITLHEVHQPGRILDEAVSQGDERIDAPVGDP